MKKYYILVFLIACFTSFSAFAQKNKDNKDSKDSKSTQTTQAAETEKNTATTEFGYGAEKDPVTTAFEQKQAVYQLALRYGDGVVAKTALYEMMIIRPDMKNLRDSLAMIYFNMKEYASCIILSTELLKEKPEDAKLLEMKALSFKSLGYAKEALAEYEKLFASAQHPLYLYEIAALQFQLKRLGECNASLDQLLSNAEADKYKVYVALENGLGQEVPVKAACHNIRGNMQFGLKANNEAKASFEAALKLFPDFVLAKNNLAILEAEMKKAAGTKTGGK